MSYVKLGFALFWCCRRIVAVSSSLPDILSAPNVGRSESGSRESASGLCDSLGNLIRAPEIPKSGVTMMSKLRNKVCHIRARWLR